MGEPAKNIKSVKTLEEEIERAMCEIDAFVAERKNINDQISATIERMEALGINRDAFRLALKYRGLSEAKREGIDVSYATCRRAIGMPIEQGELDLTK